ncbi:hypothetical protein DM02DRAFT_671197 [Periconia macrospinosa]|uniref:Alpha/beta-hydrolase n=1 Tax=Periconia macrospinosa TaxID=97972 RepID=A0A2V1DTB4_9PLEO|nr:hypothetical protein DM02DRAFT_671197 [Periconia macrospinosa]
MGALEFLCHRRFHQTYTLPPNPAKGRTAPHRFSYADYGDASSNSVVLLCGALFGTRLSYTILDKLAKNNNVRIIHPDRPGVGGSEAVKLEERIGIWLELIPKLLAHLNIQHVSLASHSGGDIYLLNTILSYPSLLHPTHPYICFFAPWVHHSHTKVTKLQALEYLPESLIGNLSPFATFVNAKILPVSAASGTIFQGVKGFLSNPSAPSTTTPTAITAAAMSRASGEELTLDLDLDDNDVVTELRNHITTFVFAESTTGVSLDAQLLLKRPHSTVWCAPELEWGDIDDVPPLLSQIIHDEEGRSGERGRKWVIDAFHAESDHMVGDKGRVWFDKCWVGEGYEYRSQVVKGGDHDFLMDPVFGATSVWLERVREAFEAGG